MASPASSKEEGGGVPPQNKTSWGSFLKADTPFECTGSGAAYNIQSLASYNGDIASLTAPPFIVGTISLTEFSAYWAEHPSIFTNPCTESDPEKRALLVLKWFLSTLKQQYSSRSDKLGSEKKPLNPFLGELFLAKWEDNAGTTQLVSEQVSHHPPVTAYCIWNDKHNIQLQGYNGQKVSFSRTIYIKQIGHALLRLNTHDETYLITLPNLHIEGLIYGKPFIELDGNSHIISSSGYVAKIDYSGKGWLSGKKNTFSATLSTKDKPKEALYTVDGQWTDSFTIKATSHAKHSGSGSSTADKLKAKSHSVVEDFKHASNPTTPLKVPPQDTQDPYESQKAWASVKAAIKKGDMDLVHVEKSKIENAQRELRKKEKGEGRVWEQRFFEKHDKSDIFESLAGGYCPTGIEAEKTGGVWRFDEAKKVENKKAQDGDEKAKEQAKEVEEKRGVGAVVDKPPPSMAPQESVD